MIKFKVGDKVKFLNESGGGVVSRIISPKMVNVLIEDGFEIPILTAELLRIEEEAPVDSPKHMFREDFHADIDPTAASASYPDEGDSLRLTSIPSRGMVEQGIYLAFIPEDQKWLITGLLDIYLVNHTRFDILYSVFLEKEEGSYSGYDYGSIEAESMVLLDSVEREKLPKWEKGVVQVLYHADRDNKVLEPGSSSFRNKLPRFYKESSYVDSAIIDGKAVLVALLPLAAQTSLLASGPANKDMDKGEKLSKAEEVKPEHIIDRHRTSPKEAVVDLHIEELVEDHSHMDNSAILRVQVNYFTRCLDNAIVNHLTKVTFIHGVGTGVLKTAIKEILKEYPNVVARDASMKDFGYGAMDVVIR